MKKIIKLAYKYRYWIVLVLALISRFALTSAYKDFFDSMQYVWRTDSGSLLDALSTGHAPFHPGYIFFTYYANHLLHLFHIFNTELAATLPSLLFGSLAILVFFAFTEKLFDTKIASLATIFAALVPYFWISNLAIIVDPTMIFFYLLSLYLYFLWLDNKKHPWHLLIFSGFAFGWAMWAHTQVAFWVFGFIGLIGYKIKPGDYFKYILKSIPWIIGPLFFIGIYLYLLVYSGYSTGYREAAHYLFLGNAGDRMGFSLLPGIRNYLIIMSVFLAGLSVIGFIKMIIKKTKIAIFLLIWLIPGLFLGALYLYANLYGRASIIAIFPGVIAASYLLVSWQPQKKFILALKYIVIILAVAQLAYISFPIVNSYADEYSPYDEMDALRKTLPPDGLIILSNLEKTLVGYEGDHAVVWEMPKDEINQKIKKAEDAGKPIYVDMDAIRFPYYQYDGRNWEIKSTNIDPVGKDKSFVSYLYSLYNFDLALTSGLGNKVGTYIAYKNDISPEKRLKNNIQALKPNQVLIFGQLFDDISALPVSQTAIDIYSDSEPISRQKINYNDWLYYLYNNYQKQSQNESHDPLNWTYTDKNGYFVTSIPKNEANNIRLTLTTYNLPLADVLASKDSNSGFQFVNPGVLNISQDQINKGKIQSDNINSLAEKFPAKKGYYAVIKKISSSEIFYEIYSLNYSLDVGNTLKAELLPYEVGELTDEGLRTKKGDKGFLTYGPWLSLEAGEYEITYILKTSKDTDDELIGSIEVTSKNIDNPLAKRDLKLENFPNANEFYEIKTEFKLNSQIDEVEFKTIPNGVVDFTVGGISIIKK